MALHAALLLQVAPTVIRSRFSPAAGVVVPAGREALAGADGTPFALSPLEDAVVVWTGTPLDTEDADMAGMAVALLGKALDAHTDTRGLFVFPDVAVPRSATYATAVEELGELGMWLALPGRARAPRIAVPVAPDAPAQEVTGEVVGGLPPDATARMKDILAGADPSVLDAARQQFEQMASQPGGMDAMGDQIAAMMGGGGDMAAMLQQAQAQIAEMQKNDPEGFAALERQAMQMLAGMTGGRK